MTAVHRLWANLGGVDRGSSDYVTGSPRWVETPPISLGFTLARVLLYNVWLRIKGYLILVSV
jgi:hypothetical protein